MAYTFTPHGLIINITLAAPYRDAKRSVDAYGNEINPKEHSTVHLFENVFNRVLFVEEEFFVNSQVPPASKRGAEKACDLAIKRVTDDLEHQIFCFAEAKRARNSSYSKIQELENQALGYCIDHLEANPDKNLIYACTLVGASMRCWSYGRGNNNLTPFWGDALPDYSQYLDIGLDENRATLETCFSQMKRLPLDGVGPMEFRHADIGRVQHTLYLPSQGTQMTEDMAAFSANMYGVADYQSSQYGHNDNTLIVHGGSSEAATDTGDASENYFTADVDPTTSHGLFETSGSGSYTQSSIHSGNNSEKWSWKLAQERLKKETYVTAVVVKEGATFEQTRFEVRLKGGNPTPKTGRDFRLISYDTDQGVRWCWAYEGRTSHKWFWTDSLEADKKGKKKA